jgi:hypothetical protein
MTSWFKLQAQRCRECGSAHFCLARSSLIFCDRCGALFEERPIGRHEVTDPREPIQLQLISS